jgi:glycosyltransferase involved in cell wall biosynthesis
MFARQDWSATLHGNTEARHQATRIGPVSSRSSPVRILFVTESFGIGGTEAHLLELLPSLQAKGFDTAAFCFSELGARARVLQDAGVPITAASGIGTARKRSLLAPIRLAGGAAMLLGLIKRWRPTIIHFFLPGPYLAGAPTSIFAGVPIKIMSRRSLSDYQRKWPGAASLERMLHPHMDAVLGNSRAVVDELIGKEGCPESQVRLIYNGVRISENQTTRAEAAAVLGLSEQAFVATVIANLFSYKGHLNLIAALAQIPRELPRPWNLLCAGRDEGEGSAIARMIAEKGLADNVRLLGERSDVPLLLAASDIGILSPIRNEGLSNAVLESMAAGLPMVVTDVGGNAELVIDGKTGFVVPPHDASSLAAAILRLARDAGLRQTLGNNARRRVAEQFSFRASVDQYCSLYEELLARER